MFTHVTLGIGDFERALGFYRPLMTCLGHRERFCYAGVPWAGWRQGGADRPLFVITTPFDGMAPGPGNGAMVAFPARTAPW